MNLLKKIQKLETSFAVKERQICKTKKYVLRPDCVGVEQHQKTPHHGCGLGEGFPVRGSLSAHSLLLRLANG